MMRSMKRETRIFYHLYVHYYIVNGTHGKNVMNMIWNLFFADIFLNQPLKLSDICDIRLACF